jgi:fermentation-respiration switch protein FrsA (DUF1100 family)
VHWIFKLLSVAVIMYLLLAAWLFLMQSRMLYLPDIGGRQLIATPADIGLAYEDVELVSAGRYAIHGWYVPAAEGRRTLLFLHGNAGNVSHRLQSIELFHRLGLNVLIIDYRGYGRSAGKPDEAGTYQDAESAWRHLVERRGHDPRDIIVFGRSLGAAVAAWLASRHEPGMLIVESAFSSIESVGRHYYPWLPVNLLSRYHYPTVDYVARSTCPVLIIHSRNDEIIPFHEARRIYDAASGRRMLLEIDGDHNTGFLQSGDKYIEGIRRFITENTRPDHADMIK